MNTQWVKIRSWHALTPDAHFGPNTRCGLHPGDDAETRDTLPREKSCERCLRILARMQDDEAVN